MKILYLLLVIFAYNVALIKASSSSSTSSTSSSFPATDNFDCAGPDGVCGYFSKFCKSGYTCQNFFINNETNLYQGECLPALQLGDVCNSIGECSIGLKCSPLHEEGSSSDELSYCVDIGYASVGEECEKNEQCLGSLKCIDSKCSNVDCSEIHNCPSQHYCSTGKCTWDTDCADSEISVECAPVSPVGGWCYYGYECNINSTCVNGKCVEKYSLKDGEDCTSVFGYSSDACESLEAIFTNNDETHGISCKCAKPNSTIYGNCTQNGCPTLQFCNTKTDMCTPYISTSQECKNARIERDQCYVENNCIILNSEPFGEFQYNKKSCHMKSCEKESLNYYNQCYMFKNRICDNQ
ncbi:hypothetical protein DICPUDRAFT_30918 [Dictyostelium purpureum]|uniref:Dickkopf N-terminal cysteine-rich domain-containing protein n=1 Tax=Dictyostelium purpureum TaxID=5786 RepID=F0ZG61_DICPU|nr:uncharacterized protein DICPUDRAFT_30918 [Dictyostelium purpureum]EGC37066.1 hypothetical protein DICPUDRAFT_30918 [Dictyostelium purpureum]|eukprot:XP_003286423.1 hypothetical protein DICPUDRAFT_30918 [Dictyostelium purpureum]